MKPTLLVISFLLVAIQNAPVGPLYSPTDGVEILTVETFKNLVENSTTGWLVEFYASWCGYCQRFAPHWTEFAREAATWRDLLRVGVVECSDPRNMPLCREYDIQKIPTVRYFHEGYQSGMGDIGVVVPHGQIYSVWDIKKNVVETLIGEIRNGRGSMYPNLLPYTNPTTEGLFEGVSPNVKYAILVVEPFDVYLGAELALDWHQTPDIVVRQALQNNTGLVSDLRVKLPAVVVVDRGTNRREVITDNVGTRNQIKRTLASFLQSRGVNPVEMLPRKVHNSTDDSREQARLVWNRRIKAMGDVVFQADLESALRYSLQQEVGVVETIKGEQLRALQSYVAIIKQYFPFVSNGTSFITQLFDLTTKSEIQGATVQKLVQDAQSSAFSTPPETYIGCMGSTPTFRGYPCGLWRLFHFFTVNSYQLDRPREVLETMLAYVKNFFTCQHCSQHFQQMAIERNLTSVSTLEESMLWLWEAHNVVNARLKGDVTEDPEFPKEQFPTKDNCRECYHGDGKGKWNKDEVSKYLRRMYGRFNVRHVDIDEIVATGKSAASYHLRVSGFYEIVVMLAVMVGPKYIFF